MPFEIFTRKVQYKGEPSVSLTKLGRFAFNKAATEHFEKNAIEFLLLLWDKERRLIGVRPISKKDTRSYQLRTGKKGNGSGFSASTFLDHIGLDYSETRTFPAQWDEHEAMFIIEVPKEYLKK